jgi:hypothetical protein
MTGEQMSGDPTAQEHEGAPSYAAARLLEIAARNADAIVEDARAEATAIVADARAQAEALTARAEEQRLEQDRAHRTAMQELDERRTAVEAEVNRLAEFERRHRDHLVSYFNEQLETLRRPGEEASGEEPGPTGR